jgi:nucleoid-associated protein Lsr2
MQKLDVQLEDDLTGGPADETIRFSLDGRAYEIDLNAKHAEKFRRQLAPFIEHARQGARLRGFTTPRRTAASRERSRQIRAWAEHQGLSVPARGRLPGAVVDQYRQAHTNEKPARRSARTGSGRTRSHSTRLTESSCSPSGHAPIHPRPAPVTHSRARSVKSGSRHLPRIIATHRGRRARSG